MKYQAVLFDMDGTLLNTLGDIGGTLNVVLEANGYPTHTMAEYRHLVGNGARRLTKDACRRARPRTRWSGSIFSTGTTTGIIPAL